jgi:hypothetical protein
MAYEYFLVPSLLKKSLYLSSNVLNTIQSFRGHGIWCAIINSKTQNDGDGFQTFNLPWVILCCREPNWIKLIMIPSKTQIFEESFVFIQNWYEYAVAVISGKNVNNLDDNEDNLECTAVFLVMRQNGIMHYRPCIPIRTYLDEEVHELSDTAPSK